MINYDLDTSAKSFVGGVNELKDSYVITPEDLGLSDGFFSAQSVEGDFTKLKSELSSKKKPYASLKYTDDNGSIVYRQGSMSYNVNEISIQYTNYDHDYLDAPGTENRRVKYTAHHYLLSITNSSVKIIDIPSNLMVALDSTLSISAVGDTIVISESDIYHRLFNSLSMGIMPQFVNSREDIFQPVSCGMNTESGRITGLMLDYSYKSITEGKLYLLLFEVYSTAPDEIKITKIKEI